MIPGVGIGVIFAAPSPSARFAPSASWPEGRRAPAHLGEAAEQALTERRGSCSSARPATTVRRRAVIDTTLPIRSKPTGEFVRGTPIVKLAQIHPLRVEVIAPVALLGKLSPGMTAEVLPESPIGGVHPAKVTVVDRVVDAASGTFGVRLEVPNPNYRLPAGLKCKARFSR
jgi:multidrug efflux pump subunit AcrA (membrane-fusion protein)